MSTEAAKAKGIKQFVKQPMGFAGVTDNCYICAQNTNGYYYRSAHRVGKDLTGDALSLWALQLRQIRTPTLDSSKLLVWLVTHFNIKKGKMSLARCWANKVKW